MKKVKSILGAFIITMGLSTAVFAGDKKTDVKTAVITTTESVAPAPAKAKAKSGVTYWVTGTTIVMGVASYTFDQTPQSCDGSGNPCQFTTDNGALSSPQPQSVIDGENGLIIDTRKN
ncbi:hypothetical protein BDD43_0832 [Mucilaginibacter gracilis]|uniref:Uncharacterized protein n=1 Tax=Mucilaginibacter gracilis TaxID=423350 RepID=A0A495IVF6_9SPHI|nr:acid shock protein [Mucilaginibacter gracilis]RKR80700.1 hypothetical protein BDD43_0832 [Mucilaginibacter gracilis]